MGPAWRSSPARRYSPGKSNLVDLILGLTSAGLWRYQVKSGPSHQGEQLEWASQPRRGVLGEPGAKCKGGRQEMPNRAGPSSEGKPGFRLLRGRGWGNTARPWETRTLVGLHPWLALAQSPASLPAPPPCMAQKKKGNNHPGNSIWSRNLQGPWVPGSLRRRGWRAGNAEGRCPGRGTSGGRGRAAAPGPLGQDGRQLKGCLETQPWRGSCPGFKPKLQGKCWWAGRCRLTGHVLGLRGSLRGNRARPGGQGPLNL